MKKNFNGHHMAQTSQSQSQSAANWQNMHAHVDCTHHHAHVN